MQQKLLHTSYKKLDSYSLLICSKYFESSQDFINIICVNSKFKETTEKLRFNPISINSLKLFPKIQTQYFYSKNDIKIEGIDNYQICYKVNYDQYLQVKKDNIQFKDVVYTKEDRLKYGDEIPHCVDQLSDNCFNGVRFIFIVDDGVTKMIPSTIKSIGNCCFNNCTSLQSINLPSKITSLGSQCFNNCESLKIIDLSSKLSSLNEGCFSGCSSLETINLPTKLISLGNECFSYCSSLKSIKLPSSLSSLNDWCFNGCTSLQSINLSLTLTLKSVGDACFVNCLSLESIKLPLSLMSLGDGCFNSCTSLQSINLPSKLTSVGNACFINCLSLKSIDFPLVIISVGKKCFFGCKSLTKLSIPNTVKKIGISSYEGCSSLNELSLPLNENNKYPFKVTYNECLNLKKCGINCEKVLITGNYCHYSFLTNVTNVSSFILNINYAYGKTTIPNNVISMKSNYLSYRITSITIPTSVTYLCNECFKNYVNLKSITIPTTVKYIGKHIIDGCNSLINIEYDCDWNNIIVSYNDYLRYNGNGLVFNSIEYTNDDKIKYGKNIPLIVNSLNKSYYHSFDKTLTIPTHITSLDNYMFSCINSNLQNIVIPTSIKTIPKYCFLNCSLLTNVELPTTLISIKKNSFSNCKSLQIINIPSSVIEIEKYTFEYCYSLISIILPEHLSTLGIRCFKGCHHLKYLLNIPYYYF